MSTIEVFADVTCPFTHVGLRRLVEHRERIGRDDVRLVVRAWPLELVNGAPLTGAFVDEEIVALRAQVAPDLFTGFAAERFPATTLPALRLTHAAYELGVAIGERCALELRDRLFERGEDVADRDVLAEVATGVGLDAAVLDRALDPPDGAEDPVEADWAAGRDRGVIGSPHFFARGVDAFCPTLHIERIDGELSIRLDEPAFDDFTARCFA